MLRDNQRGWRRRRNLPHGINPTRFWVQSCFVVRFFELHPTLFQAVPSDQRFHSFKSSKVQRFKRPPRHSFDRGGVDPLDSEISTLLVGGECNDRSSIERHGLPTVIYRIISK
jgi:hypothetical protein